MKRIKKKDCTKTWRSVRCTIKDTRYTVEKVSPLVKSVKSFITVNSGKGSQLGKEKI
ncbi:MAG: hypothetical protein L6N96_03195 [Candidatus Methylarchaceae archaeon HK02M2]|nr:hypothetical protein [Candidatus Methylarchaceae archaeon HK02M2]